MSLTSGLLTFIILIAPVEGTRARDEGREGRQAGGAAAASVGRSGVGGTSETEGTGA